MEKQNPKISTDYVRLLNIINVDLINKELRSNIGGSSSEYKFDQFNVERTDILLNAYTNGKKTYVDSIVRIPNYITLSNKMYETTNKMNELNISKKNKIKNCNSSSEEEKYYDDMEERKSKPKSKSKKMTKDSNEEKKTKCKKTMKESETVEEKRGRPKGTKKPKNKVNANETSELYNDDGETD